MKIIEPKVELWLQEDAKAHVARCARVCYGRETGNDEATIKRLIDSKHWSMFRHESVYAMIPVHDRNLKELPVDYANCPYINIHVFDGYVYVSTNRNFIMYNEGYPFINLIKQYQVDKDKFISIEEHRQITMLMLRYTFKVTTQISTSRELNRVSPNNIAERSTRYVYEDGSICRPHWLKDYNIVEYFYNKYAIYKDGIEQNDINTHKVHKYIESCDRGFDDYQYLVKAGLHRQDARGVLPLDTATECVYTYSYKEWCHILDLRYYGTTGVPHPNAKIIAGMIRNELMELGYEFREG
jgi:thymidylate synthase (FAD)